MSFYADLHVHSRYARATSRNADLVELAWWARRKGITVLGTGDLTHPAWFEELTGAWCRPSLGCSSSGTSWTGPWWSGFPRRAAGRCGSC